MGVKRNVAIIGGETLLAQELKELLEESGVPLAVTLVAASEEASSILTAALTADDEEPVVLAPLNEATLDGMTAIFLAGSAASGRRAKKIAPCPVFDATEGHAAAMAIAGYLATVSKLSPILRSNVHVFEPASERGKRGLEELRQQTVAVLNFQKLNTDVFDTQVGFNMLARYGEEAEEALELIEERLEKHLASLLARHAGIPTPSLRLIQAPVFHGHSVSLWTEFEHPVSPADITEALKTAGFDVREEEPPANAGIAGHAGIAVGAVSADKANDKACWAWLVADNLKLAAESAVAHWKTTL